MITALIASMVYLGIGALFYWAAGVVVVSLPLIDPILAVTNVVLVVALCLGSLYALLAGIPAGRVSQPR